MGHLTNLFATIIVLGVSAYFSLYASVLFRKYVIKDFKIDPVFNATTFIAQAFIFIQAMACLVIELSILRMKLGVLPPGWSVEASRDYPGKLGGIDLNLLMWVTLAASVVFFLLINYWVATSNKNKER